MTASLALLIILAPTASFAKEKNEVRGNAEVRVERVEKPERNHACFRAFGHLIAKGFIKNKGELEANWNNCTLPWGIAKKLHRGTSTASSTPDTVAPVIKSVEANIGTTTKIRVTANEPVSAALSYGTSSASSTASVSQSFFNKIHTFVLENLSASTTYSFSIEAKDKSGNATTSAQSSFSTR